MQHNHDHGLCNVRALELGEDEHRAALHLEVCRGGIDEPDHAREAPTPLWMCWVRVHLVDNGKEELVWVAPEVNFMESEESGEGVEGARVVAEELGATVLDVCPVLICMDVQDEGMKGTSLTRCVSSVSG